MRPRFIRADIDAVANAGQFVNITVGGAGPDTTVGRERATNPYLHEAASRHG